MKVIEYGVSTGLSDRKCVKDKAQAEDLHFRLKQQRLEPYLTDILPAIDPIE